MVPACIYPATGSESLRSHCAKSQPGRREAVLNTLGVGAYVTLMLDCAQPLLSSQRDAIALQNIAHGMAAPASRAENAERRRYDEHCDSFHAIESAIAALSRRLQPAEADLPTAADMSGPDGHDQVWPLVADNGSHLDENGPP